MRLLLSALLLSIVALAQQPDAKTISDRIHKLRDLPDDQRARVTKQLALDIRSLPKQNQSSLAAELANMATEGDFGRDTLQEVTTTLDQALTESPAPPAKDGSPSRWYFELASLARYEHMRVALNGPQYLAALKKLEADDRARDNADFTLTDLNGKSWNRKSLTGKIVLVNFWATWCPPCRKEMPDLNALYKRYENQGLVILALSDEEATVVKPFIAEKQTDEQKVSYPILLDPGGKVHTLFGVDGIPKSFIYNRAGKLAAQSIDMRTMNQFLDLLKQAGLKP